MDSVCALCDSVCGGGLCVDMCKLCVDCVCVWTACVLYRTLDLFSSQFRTLITEPLATFMVCMWELEYVED